MKFQETLTGNHKKHSLRSNVRIKAPDGDEKSSWYLHELCNYVYPVQGSILAVQSDVMRTLLYEVHNSYEDEFVKYSWNGFVCVII